MPAGGVQPPVVTVHPLNAGNGLVEVTLTLIARSVVIAPASPEPPTGVRSSSV